MNNRNHSITQVIIGDIDYIANPQKINKLFHCSVEAWKVKVEKLFVQAEQEKASIISLFGRISGMNEIEIIDILIEIANKRPDQKVLFHFFQSESLELIIEKYQGNPILNYLSAEDWMLEKLLPILAKRPMGIVLQTIGDGGIPETVDQRLQLIKKAANKLEAVGYQREDIFIDTLSPSCTLLPKVVEVGLQTIKKLQASNYRTILWPANFALGESNLQEVVSSYIKIACENGLDFAVVDSEHIGIIEIINEKNKNKGDTFMFNSKLENYRSKIDKIDKKILSLLIERIDVSFNIGKLKKENHVDLLDESREKKMIENLVNSNYGQTLPKELIKNIFLLLLQHCREISASRLNEIQTSEET